MVRRLRWVLLALLPCFSSCAETLQEDSQGDPEDPAGSLRMVETSDGSDSSFELYSTLAGKMARMEELLNGVDRFLGDPDFQERLVLDATEFRRLTLESRELFPEALIDEDKPGFREAIDRTVEVADGLIEALRENRKEEALAALEKLDRIRRDSHEDFSY
ncbi:MAG: hypothetical protein AAGJ79_06350 [Verrucomicrobiota bacterium]